MNSLHDASPIYKGKNRVIVLYHSEIEERFRKMVIFAVVLLLSIDTVASALTERQVSALADIREGVALLGNVNNESRVGMI